MANKKRIRGMNKKGAVESLNLVLGIFLIGGGIAYLLNKPAIGGIAIAFTVAIELLTKYLLGSK